MEGLAGPYFAGSVRARLVRFALLLLVPAFAISALLTWRVFITEREGAEIALRESARGLGQVIDREFAEAELLLRTLAATDELARGDMPAFDSLARATQVMGGTVVMTDRTGQELIDTGLPAGSPLPRVPPGDWDTEQPGHLIISSLEPLPRIGTLGIRIVLPVAGSGPVRAGTYRYDLALVVPPSSFQAVLAHEKLPAGWFAAVLDRQATVVARSLRAKRFLGTAVRPRVKAVLANAMEGVTDGVSLEGTPVIVAYSRSSQTGWTVLVNASRLLVDEEGRQSTWLLVWLGAVAILLGWLGALHVARGIASRIEAMAKAARILGDTETWTPIPRGLDEADAVAEAMQTAANALIERREALSELNATLSARVEARTAELAAANRAIEEQRRNLGTILDHMPVGVVVHGQNNAVVFANLEARRLLGLAALGPVAPEEWPTPRRGAAVIAPEQLPWVLAAKGQVTERDLINVDRPGGAQLDLEVNASPLMRDADGTIILSVTTLQDVTARLEAEEARRRSQRLEAVGQLTGGVAHEFNNLLMAISGCLELLTPFVADGRGSRLLGNAARATERGGRLTRQLLAFSRRQHLQPEPVDLNMLVSGMTELLESTLGRLVEIATMLDPAAWMALADAPQLELVLLNLAINARDAMAGGGKLTIRTSNRRMGPPLQPEDPPEGEFAVLTVSDTGHGMAPHVLARAFEPFFTTKEIGLGSGLGLPQVLGVAQQLGGGVSIASMPGHGTTVEVFLPRAHAEPKRVFSVEHGGGRSALLGGSHLLVVDDDSDVREIARDMLEEMGAVVSEAESAGAALLHLRTSRVDLVLADLTMPHVTGIEMARHIADFLPDLPVVLMTGYGTAALDVTSQNIRATLQKPFRAETLAKVLSSALGRDTVAAIEV